MRPMKTLYVMQRRIGAMQWVLMESGETLAEYNAMCERGRNSKERHVRITRWEVLNEFTNPAAEKIEAVCPDGEWCRDVKGCKHHDCVRDAIEANEIAPPFFPPDSERAAMSYLKDSEVWATIRHHFGVEP